MTITDQCPSTHGPKAKVHRPSKEELARARASGPRVMQNAAGMSRGMVAWRSLDEVADNSEFREHVEKEFPHGALEMQKAFEAGGETRRDFLKIMGGSMALAGVAMIPGCRRPDHKILPFAKEPPEEIIPG